MALAGTACAPPAYVPPALSEPHATVVIRVLHHEVSGRDLVHRTLIDGREVSHAGRVAVVRGAPLTRAVRVRPVPIRWSFASVFSHTEQRLQTVYETERYACGTQTSGYGSTTRTSTRYCSRQVPRQRWQTVRVTDGACEAVLLQTPHVGRRYVVHFDYNGHRSCRARCFEQTPLPGGRFQLTPCSLRAAEPTAGAAAESPPAPTASARADGSATPPASTPEPGGTRPGRGLTAP